MVKKGICTTGLWILCGIVLLMVPAAAESSTDALVSIQASSHTAICMECHLIGDLHAKSGHTDCSDCHEGTPQTGNVEADSCSQCHPIEAPDKCGIVSEHGTNCSRCHAECFADDSSTTTTAITAAGHTQFCISCHLVGDLHAKSGHTSCTICHDGTPEAGNVDAGACISCHPSGDAGKCNLANFHKNNCLGCHITCSETTTTTTAIATTTTTIAPTSTHIEMCFDCHYTEDLHEKDDHDDCAACHEGTPAAGNVKPGACVLCHPTGDPGKCNITTDHGGTCAACHIECTDTPATSTVASTTTTVAETSLHIDVCNECHFPSDLHEKSGHTSCDACHTGTPAEGNVEPAACIACHPFTGKGKCNLTSLHGTSCVTCHFECDEASDSDPTTTAPGDTDTTTVPATTCPATVVLDGDAVGLGTLRTFRDTVLSRSPAGQYYVNAYYRYAPEMVRMILHNREIRNAALDCLAVLLPEIEQILFENNGRLSADACASAIDCLNLLRQSAAPGFLLVIEQAETDLERMQVVNGRLVL